MAFSYHTIKEPSTGVYKEKGSKFLAFAFPVISEDEVKSKLEGLRKQYFDARHHCYAYMVGVDKPTFRANDDGEPNHSAGDPILGQIRSKKLTNILVVVIRYFGGVKLGVGGLITAYKTAAEEALLNAVVVQKEIYEELEYDFDYASRPEVMRMVKDFDLKIIDQLFGVSCKIRFRFGRRVGERLMERINLLRVLGHLR